MTCALTQIKKFGFLYKKYTELYYICWVSSLNAVLYTFGDIFSHYVPCLDAKTKTKLTNKTNKKALDIRPWILKFTFLNFHIKTQMKQGSGVERQQ